MSLKLDTFIAEHSGLVYTRVPGWAMWDLVEFLSTQRTLVHYGYVAGGFTVTFLRIDQESAQALLDDWAASKDAQRAAISTPDIDAAVAAARDLCFIPG